MTIRSRFFRALPWLAITLLPCVWWWPLLVGWLPDFMDTVAYLYPLRMAVARQIHSGTPPFWLPSIFCGVPLAPNPQVATWYPFQVLFYAWPGPISYGVLCILHYVIAAAGTYLLAFRLTRRRDCALLAALLVEFGSMLVSRVALAPHLYTAAWIPWALLMAERIGRHRSMPRMMRNGVLLSVVLAFQLLAGAPQVSYYTVIAVALLWLTRSIQLLAPRRSARAAAVLAIAGILALGLAAIQLGPTLAYSDEARKTIASEQLRGQAIEGSMLWRAFVGFSGTPLEDTDSINAIGLLPMLFALLALAVSRSRRAALPYVLIGLVGFVLSLAALVPTWCSALPMYSRFHAPRRALILWSMTGPIAAACGAALIAGWMQRRHISPWAFRLLLVVAGLSAFWILPRIEREFTNPAHLMPDPHYVQQIGHSRYISVDPTFNYAYDSRRPDYGKAMLPNLAAMDSVLDAQGYDPLVPPRYALAASFANRTSGSFWPSHGAFFTDPSSPILRVLGVQYLVGRFDLLDPGRAIRGTHVDIAATSAAVELIVGDTRWPLWKYRDARPMAWVPESVSSVPSPSEALFAVSSANPHREAFVEDRLQILTPAPPAVVSAQYTDERTFRIQLASPCDAMSLLCVSIGWAEGWTATNEHGSALSTLPVDGAITGVLMPASTQTITLRFTPNRFWNGAFISVASVGLLAALWHRSRKPRQSAA